MLDVLRSLVSVATSGVVVANLNRKLFCKVHAAALGGREWDLLEDLAAHAEEAEKEQEEDIIDALLEASIAPSAGYSSEAAVVPVKKIDIPAALTVAEAADVLSRGLSRIMVGLYTFDP